jgi:hypothetical protein
MTCSPSSTRFATSIGYADQLLVHMAHAREKREQSRPAGPCAVEADGALAGMGPPTAATPHAHSCLRGNRAGLARRRCKVVDRTTAALPTDDKASAHALYGTCFPIRDQPLRRDRSPFDSTDCDFCWALPAPYERRGLRCHHCQVSPSQFPDATERWSGFTRTGEAVPSVFGRSDVVNVVTAPDVVSGLVGMAMEDRDDAMSCDCVGEGVLFFLRPPIGMGAFDGVVKEDAHRLVGADTLNSSASRSGRDVACASYPPR